MPTRPRRAAAAAPETEDQAAAAAEVFKDDIEKVDGIYVDRDGNPMTLFPRLAKIIASLPDMQPEGENKHFNYKFISDKQVLGHLRPRLSAQRIVIIPETVEEQPYIELTTAKGGRSMLTRILVTFRVIDGLDGESFTGQALGYGDDSGDKGANKAYTAALKNFLIKLFLIGGDTDIESDEETDKRARARSSGAPTVTSVTIEDSAIEGIQRGGRSTKATDVQVARVGQYARDLQLNAGAVASMINTVLGDMLDLGEKPWEDVKTYLESLSGIDIGKLLTSLAELWSAANTPESAAPDDLAPSA